MAKIKIPDGNVFGLRITGQITNGDYTETADFSVVKNMIVNFVRRGREAQEYEVEDDGLLLIENDGNLARGVYGVEMVGYFVGKPWRFFEKGVFSIVDESEDADDPTEIINDVPIYDVSINVSFGGNGVSADYVDDVMAAHESDLSAHSDVLVADVQVNDVSVVEETTDEEGNQQRTAKIVVPTALSEFQNDSGFATRSEAQAMADTVNAAVEANTEEIDALRQQYEALTQSDIIPVASADWPLAELEANTIYRVAGTDSYTDYMYDGTNTIPLATYTNGIDELPTVLSENLVKSTGAASGNAIIYPAKRLAATVSGTSIISVAYNTLSYIPIKANQTVRAAILLHTSTCTYFSALAQFYFATAEPAVGTSIATNLANSSLGNGKAIYVDYTASSDGYLIAVCNKSSVASFISQDSLYNDRDSLSIGKDRLFQTRGSSRYTLAASHDIVNGVTVSVSGIPSGYSLLVGTSADMTRAANCYTDDVDTGWMSVSSYEGTFYPESDKVFFIGFKKSDDSSFESTDYDTIFDAITVSVEFASINLTGDVVKSAKVSEFFNHNYQPEMEMGGITINSSGWTYNSSTTRVRTPEGTTIHLVKGDVISLTDYTDARMYIGWRTSGGTYGYAGWLTEDFTASVEGDYVILVSNITETTLSDVSDLADLVRVHSLQPLWENRGGSSTDTAAPYATNLADNFIPLTQAANLTFSSGTCVAHSSYRCYYGEVKSGDKVQLFMRTTTGEAKTWYYAFFSEIPAEDVEVLAKYTTVNLLDNGQISDVVTAPADGYVALCFYENNNGDYTYFVAEKVDHKVTLNDLAELEEEIGDTNLDTIYPVAPSLTKYHHLFIDKIYNESEVTVPSQSLADVRVAAKLGFNLMELNIMLTSDSVQLCRHQVDGKFEGLLDSEDNVVAVTPSEMTYADFAAAYRYNSIVPQFRVTPATLEETLAEMRKYNIQPFVNLATGVRDLVEKYFGKRYVAYYSGTTRPSSMTGVTAFVYSSANTVADVKAAIDGWGAPYMHGIASPTSFTDDELLELLDYAHERGCSIGWAGSYSPEATNQHYYDLGLDFNASGWDIPEFEYGNVIDIQGNSLNGFSDFTLSGGATTDSDGAIVLATGESISATAASKLLGKCLLDVTFVGSINVTMGSHIVNSPYTESTARERVFTSVMENEALAFTITATAETTIYSVDFKGSQVI